MHPRTMSEMLPLGVVLAIGAGSAINIGIVIQKKAVNEIPPDKRDEKFFHSLVRRRTWLLGLLVQVAVGTTLTIIAQAYVGAALLPGLLAVGLIPMAIGASKIVGESLKVKEIVAIGLIIVAATLLGFSSIGISTFLDNGDVNPLFQSSLVWINEWAFTALFFGIIIMAEIVQRKMVKVRSIALAVEAGSFLALANYWITPVVAHIANLGANNLLMPWELVIGITGGVVLALTNVFNIAVTQKAFKSGNASLVIPIQQVPINVAPILIYFWIFSLPPPLNYSLPFLLIAVGLIVLSSWLLAQRQSQLERIKIEKTGEVKL